MMMMIMRVMMITITIMIIIVIAIMPTRMNRGTGPRIAMAPLSGKLQGSAWNFFVSDT